MTKTLAYASVWGCQGIGVYLVGRGTVTRCPVTRPPGREAETFRPSPKTFDATFGRVAAGEVIHKLFDRAMGPFPANVEPFSLVTREGLDRVFAELQLQEDDHLVDLCCGRGGIGLWFAMEARCPSDGRRFYLHP